MTVSRIRIILSIMVLAQSTMFVLAHEASAASCTALNCPPPPPCFGDGVSGKRVHVFYIYTSVNNALLETPAMRAAVGEASRKVNAEGGWRNLHIRFVCNNGNVTVTPLQVAAYTLQAFKSALLAAGHNSTSRIYFGMGEDGCMCGWADGGPGDDSLSESNTFNSGPHWAFTRSTHHQNYWNVVHELFHTFGAVQLSAPHSTLNWHCWDHIDVMCYDDGGAGVPEGGLPDPPPCNAGTQIDCNDDDYFNTNPTTGSYLASHWNVICSDFLENNASCPFETTPPPAPTGLTHGSRTASTIQLLWNAVTDPSGIAVYEVQKKPTLNGTWTTGCTSAGTSCTAGGLAAVTSYQFRVRARDGAGNWSGFSTVHQVATCIIGSC